MPSTSPISHRLNAFLTKSRSSLAGAERIHVAMGNEAADLDSMASSILYAFFRSGGGSETAPPVIPLINIPRDDFVLRTEAHYLFRELGLDIAALRFADEIDLETLYQTQRLRLTLIDHNILAAAQARYAGAVEAIVDHHADAGLYQQADPRTIEPVGSAATLVAEAILRERPALIDAGTATLLLATILLDTVNLDPAAKRVTPKDQHVAARLRPVAGTDPDALFARLQAEKFNISSLTTQDLLRKDYKQWHSASIRYGISTILTSLETWIAQDPHFVNGMDAFLRSRDLHCLLAMMAYTDPQQTFRRELAVLVPDPALRDRLVRHLRSTPLDLTPWPLAGPPPPGRVLLFTQGSASESRKTLQPLLHRFFAEATSGNPPS
jgi:exopolyphosphatase